MAPRQRLDKTCSSRKVEHPCVIIGEGGVICDHVLTAVLIQRYTSTMLVCHAAMFAVFFFDCSEFLIVDVLISAE